jgi:hypothetical protein
VTEQKPLRTGPSDQHVEGGTSTNQQKVMDAAKLSLSPQKLDKSTLLPDAARGERLKELAATVKWGDTGLFPGRFVAKAAWEGMREAESQPISWTRPMRWLQQQKLASPSVRACVPSVVLAHT